MDSKQLERETLGDAIVALLRNHQLMHTHGEDGHGYPLVDAMTPPGEKSIVLGLEEIEFLAGEIAWLSIPAVTPNT